MQPTGLVQQVREVQPWVPEAAAAGQGRHDDGVRAVRARPGEGAVQGPRDHEPLLLERVGLLLAVLWVQGEPEPEHVDGAGPLEPRRALLQRAAQEADARGIDQGALPKGILSAVFEI